MPFLIRGATWRLQLDHNEWVAVGGGLLEEHWRWVAAGEHCSRIGTAPYYIADIETALHFGNVLRAQRQREHKVRLGLGGGGALQPVGWTRESGVAVNKPKKPSRAVGHFKW